jgi:Family of unknown function (DUF6510)
VEALDGNALAGPLFELFGSEMTDQLGTCRFCGDTSYLAEMRVYMRAPGAVGRCHVCMNVVLVMTNIRGTPRADASGVKMPVV